MKRIVKEKTVLIDYHEAWRKKNLLNAKVVEILVNLPTDKRTVGLSFEEILPQITNEAQAVLNTGWQGERVVYGDNSFAAVLHESLNRLNQAQEIDAVWDKTNPERTHLTWTVLPNSNAPRIRIM